MCAVEIRQKLLSPPRMSASLSDTSISWCSSLRWTLGLQCVWWASCSEAVRALASRSAEDVTDTVSGSPPRGPCGVDGHRYGPEIFKWGTLAILLGSMLLHPRRQRGLTSTSNHSVGAASLLYKVVGKKKVRCAGRRHYYGQHEKCSSAVLDTLDPFGMLSASSWLILGHGEMSPASMHILAMATCCLLPCTKQSPSRP